MGVDGEMRGGGNDEGFSARACAPSPPTLPITPSSPPLPSTPSPFFSPADRRSAEMSTG